MEVLYSAVLADVMDELGFRRQALPPHIKPLDAGAKLFGRALTVQARTTSAISDEPYRKELEAVDSLRTGDVLVASVRGGARCGFWGELLSTAAASNGAVGAVIDGYTRDSDAIVALPFPLFVRGSSPLDSKGRCEVVAVGEPIVSGGVEVTTGDLVFGDRDGVVIIPQDVAEGVIARALQKASTEGKMRRALEDGMGVLAAYERYGVL